jgi:hypothetical protein
VLQLPSGRRSARLQRMIRSQVRRAFHGYCRNRTCKKTVMSGRIKAGFVDFGAVRHTSLAGQRIHHASRTVGSNPSLSAIYFEQRKSPSKTTTSRTVGFRWWSTAVEHSLPPLCHV